MFSVIETGGKQYEVAAGKKIKIEKVKGNTGETIVFDKVLLLASSEDEVTFGEPYVKGAQVTAEIVTQGLGDKLIVFKYKPKKRHRKKRGHRQPFTEVKITEIAGAK